MKKAKIILSAVGILSIVAGAVAFKAQHRFSGRLACYTTGGKTLAPNYTTTSLGSTLLCTIPGPNAYVPTVVTKVI